ncbi:uncharacterized protein TNCV_4380121 [Trichonephila clavipes]|nr:uncharacterized protein TNCV_4380121 [Trichonephila clavipes]
MVAERLARCQMRVTTVDELWHRVEASWAFVHVHAIQSLFDSMPRRISAIISAGGGCSGYCDFTGSMNPNIFKIPIFNVLEAAVAEWYRYRTVACFVTGSSPVPLKTCRVGQRCTLNLSRAETSSRWCGVVVRRGGCQLRCRPRHLTMVQNYVVRRQKPSCS